MRVARERIFQVEGVSSMCKGPEAEPGERVVGNEFG